LKILVAEDEPQLLQTYKLLLEHEGYQVVTTKDGEECIETYKAELNKTARNNAPFDVVLLDYRMPKKNGAEVAKEILALFPTQKLMMATAYGGVKELNDEKLKKMRVMSKPFDFDTLFANISTELKNV
jgi:CheY-like chemotaxis protein